MKRQPGQDVVEFITKYEDAYNKLAQCGEKISSWLQAMLLLESVDLPYFQHNLVLSAVDFTVKDVKDAKDTSKEPVEKANTYENIKQAIRKYHSSDEIHNKQTVLYSSDTR